jgi:hypothetical protein
MDFAALTYCRSDFCAAKVGVGIGDESQNVLYTMSYAQLHAVGPGQIAEHTFSKARTHTASFDGW